MKKQRGFTLVELLVVISLIGILAAISIAVLNPAVIQGKARDGARKTDLAKIKAAIELYYSQNRAYPAASVVTFGSPFTDGTNTYLKNTPNDPKSTWNYCYSLTGSNYALCASVEDAANANSVVTPCTFSPANTGSLGTYCVTNPF